MLVAYKKGNGDAERFIAAQWLGGLYAVCESWQADISAQDLTDIVKSILRDFWHWRDTDIPCFVSEAKRGSLKEVYGKLKTSDLWAMLVEYDKLRESGHLERKQSEHESQKKAGFVNEYLQKLADEDDAFREKYVKTVLHTVADTRDYRIIQTRAIAQMNKENPNLTQREKEAVLPLYIKKLQHERDTKRDQDI